MPNPNADIVANAKFAAEYLEHYGYQADQPRDATGRQAVGEGGLRLFQEFAGLPVTGLLDDVTLAKMREKRCGCPDILKSVDAAALARWRKNRLAYFIEKYVPGNLVTLEDQQLAIRNAFNDWEAVCDIKFTRVDSKDKADLIISIGSGAADNFDGPGKTLAWAFLPNGSDGQLLMRFDADESWTVSGGGIRFRNVACHEFGHMIGLEHSRVQTALMAPFYSPSVPSPVQNDDISRVQALYGPPAASPPAPPPNNPPKCPTICSASLAYLKALNRTRRSFAMADPVLNELAEKASEPCGNLCDVISKLFPKTGAAVSGVGSVCQLLQLAAEYLPKLCPQKPA